jgi:hypothetical protein
MTQARMPVACVPVPHAPPARGGVCPSAHRGLFTSSTTARRGTALNDSPAGPWHVPNGMTRPLCPRAHDWLRVQPPHELDLEIWRRMRPPVPFCRMERWPPRGTRALQSIGATRAFAPIEREPGAIAVLHCPSEARRVPHGVGCQPGPAAAPVARYGLFRLLNGGLAPTTDCRPSVEREEGQGVGSSSGLFSNAWAASNQRAPSALSSLRHSLPLCCRRC